MTRKKMLLLYICSVDYWLMSCSICYFSAKDTAGSCYTTEINDIEVLKNGWKDGAAQAEAKTDIRDKTFQ